MIKKETEDDAGKAVLEDVLIVEHKIFFNEVYRAIYDRKSKNIMAKYDKKRQGLVKDISVSTDLRSQLYTKLMSKFTMTRSTFKVNR